MKGVGWNFYMNNARNAFSSLCPGDALLEGHLYLSVVLLNPLSPRRAGLCCHTVPPLGSMLFCSSVEVCFSPRAQDEEAYCFKTSSKCKVDGLNGLHLSFTF